MFVAGRVNRICPMPMSGPQRRSTVPVNPMPLSRLSDSEEKNLQSADCVSSGWQSQHPSVWVSMTHPTIRETPDRTTHPTVWCGSKPMTTWGWVRENEENGRWGPTRGHHTARRLSACLDPQPSGISVREEHSLPR